MVSAAERQRKILEVLSLRRRETLRNLSSEFDVSLSTIRRDIETLSYSVPIYTVRGNGGGIIVADGWYLYRNYLSLEQEMLLVRICALLDENDQIIMKSIIKNFAMPKPRC